MSRIGKAPIAIPKGVTVTTSGNTVKVEGPKGKLSWDWHSAVTVEVADGQVTVARGDDEPRSRALHGTTRQLVANMVRGVSEGFEKKLEIVGVGYNAKVDKKKLVMQIGFCHPKEMPIPEGLTVETPKPTSVIVSGIDKQQVGQFAAEIRSVRPPEPYKGKGIRYLDETVRRKAAKSFGSA